jgi:TldD protein
MINKGTINDIFFEAISLGGDFAEVFIEDRVNTQFQMISGKLEKGVKGNDFGIGIRVYFGDNSVYTYSNNPDKDVLIRLLREAVYQEFTGNDKGVLDLRESSTKNHHQLNRQLVGRDEEKIALMKQASESVQKYSNEISQVIVNFIDNQQNVMIANTEGLSVKDHRMRTRISISATAEHEGGLQTGMISRGAHQDFSFYKTLDIDTLAKEAGRIAVTMAHAGYAPSGKMPVVIGNGFGGVLFHEASGHGLEATSVAKGISVYSGKEGEKVASELVTAIDNGTIQNAWGSQNFDDEGNPTQKNKLIEKGILKSYMVDRLNGRLMGRESTGSGRRQSYRYAPTSRMTNTYIDRGDSTFNEIISSTDEGIYAKYLGGGSVNPATGEFNFAVMEGYRIRKGQIMEPVRGATLIGRGFDVLNRVDMVGDDLEFAQGMCGSVSGSIPVNVGQPTLRVSEITVGGRSE